jgi:hypothetical protein
MLKEEFAPTSPLIPLPSRSRERGILRRGGIILWHDFPGQVLTHQPRPEQMLSQPENFPIFVAWRFPEAR